MMTTIIIAAAIVVAALLAYAASKPNTFAVSRTVLIAAPPEQIFPMIDDLHAQSAWSPFEKDPDMKRTHSGAPRGKGARLPVRGRTRKAQGARRNTTDHRRSGITEVALPIRLAR
ncbi:MAG TPA: hypothetical protein VIJ04_16170 [Xanthobacteraceae bacterium]